MFSLDFFLCPLFVDLFESPPCGITVTSSNLEVAAFLSKLSYEIIKDNASELFCINNVTVNVFASKIVKTGIQTSDLLVSIRDSFGKDVIVIADKYEDATYNHTTHLGVNIENIKTRDLLVIVRNLADSVKRMFKAKIDALELCYDSEQLWYMFMASRVIQAIGRKGGHRGGGQVFIMAHDRLWDDIKKYIPYKIAEWDVNQHFHDQVNQLKLEQANTRAEITTVRDTLREAKGAVLDDVLLYSPGARTDSSTIVSLVKDSGFVGFTRQKIIDKMIELSGVSASDIRMIKISGKEYIRGLIVKQVNSGQLFVDNYLTLGAEPGQDNETMHLAIKRMVHLGYDRQEILDALSSSKCRQSIAQREATINNVLAHPYDKRKPKDEDKQ